MKTPDVRKIKFSAVSTASATGIEMTMKALFTRMVIIAHVFALKVGRTITAQCEAHSHLIITHVRALKLECVE